MMTLIWDVDDVLNNLMGQWFETVWQPTHRDVNLRYSDLSVNPPHEILGVPLTDYLESLDTFRRERYAVQEPLPEVREWFQAHGTSCRHVALSAVPVSCASFTAEWVFRHFGVWVQTFAIVPSPRDTVSDTARPKTKAEYLQWLGHGDVLVEDNDQNLKAAAELGLRSVAIPRPWNQARHQSLRAALIQLTDLVHSGERPFSTV
jgi:hypothetical protein